jgi:hypothetical protein
MRLMGGKIFAELKDLPGTAPTDQRWAALPSGFETLGGSKPSGKSVLISTTYEIDDFAAFADPGS